jgi:hypothetical protein
MIENQDLAFAHPPPPRYPTLITFGYLLMIPIGTYLMRDRKPFQLKGFSIFHNGFLFGLSLYMVIETLRGMSG